MDCALYKLDSNIPAGFVKAMMKGNSYDRTVIMFGYVENILQDSVSWLPDGSVQALFSAFETGNFDQVLSVVVADINLVSTIDNFLIQNSPSIFGLQLQEGTAEALFAFAMTGNISEDITSNLFGQEREITSLQNLYNSEWIKEGICSWADQVLGFPAGQVYGIYKAYNSLQHARTLSSFWSQGIDELSALAESAIFASAQEDWVAGQLDNYIADHATATAEEIATEKLKLLDQSVRDPGALKEIKSTNSSSSDQLKAEAIAFLVTMVINYIFSDEIAAFEQAIGLVPGTGSMLVGIAVQFLCLPGVPWIAIGIFVLVNLFGYYKTELICTADGYYPKLETAPDPNVWDNPGLGWFDGMDSNTRQAKFVESAQYKANRLIADLYEMPARTGDEELVPTQVMTGRWEDVQAWQGLLPGTICKRFGGKVEGGLCAGTKAGMWASKQMNEEGITYIAF